MLLGWRCGRHASGGISRALHGPNGRKKIKKRVKVGKEGRGTDSRGITALAVVDYRARRFVTPSPFWLIFFREAESLCKDVGGKKRVCKTFFPL